MTVAGICLPVFRVTFAQREGWMAYIKQLDASKWIQGVARDAAALRAIPRDLTLSRGIQFEYDEGGFGLGDLEIALLQTQSGKPYGLIRYLEAVKKNYTMIWVEEKLIDATPLVNEIMCDLELRSSDMIWFSPELYRFQPCRLLRDDDNGNRIVMHEYDCYPDAFFHQQEFERRGHKQAYFIEMGDPKPSGWTGSWIADQAIR